jgi:hypothetical protein
MGADGPPKRLLPHRLMGIKATAITWAMRELRSRVGVLSVPVHDSLIVPVGAAMVVRGVLVEAFRREAGVTVEVTIDTPGRHPAGFLRAAMPGRPHWTSATEKCRIFNALVLAQKC